ncbi:alkaline phosphatase D family protein [Ideonella margarita]|uniref:Alkaline phosphatase D family protein n=1 Tax=Ideonella margarita TaxID=2984191 RepID=A0ABU9C730_9BURK
MGRPSQLPPARPGPHRRDFFKRSGAAAVAMAAVGPLLPGAAEAAKGEFQHGVASGDPLSDRVILWTRVTLTKPRERFAVNYTVALDPAMTQVVRSGTTRTDVGQDCTVKIDVDGLQPGTTYYYAFSVGKSVSPIGRTRTLPVGTVDQLRMAVVSCSNFAYGYFNAYRRIAERADLDLVVHLGDYLYEYGSGQYGSLRACEPAHEIVSLEDYRQRHAQYKRDADAQEMHRQHPMVAIWDDHETANDAYNAGAQNHTPGTEGEWPARVAAALQAYFEWMPVRMVSKKDPRKDNRRFLFGDLVDLTMLEERLGARSQQLPATIDSPLGKVFVQAGPFTDPTRTLLGDAQEKWLIKGLRNSPARWKLLGQGVMFAQLKAQGAPNSAGGGAFLNSDQWDGYQPARDRIYAAIKGSDGGAPIGNLLVLTGDIHSSWVAELTQDPNNADVTTGGYNPATGQGALAVEFVGTSVTSPGVNDPQGSTAAYLKSQNPHFKYIDLNQRGYMLLDINRDRVVTEYWHLDTVTSISSAQHMSSAWQVRNGVVQVTTASQTPARPSAPAPAP